MSNAQKGELFVLVFLFAAYAVVVYAPFLDNLSCLGRGDWDYFFFNQLVPYATLSSYHQFPLWNPYCCGGLSAIGNPQNRYFSPAIIFSALFGVLPGLKLEVIAHVIIGMLGMYFLMKYFNVTRYPSILAAIIFMFSSHFVLHWSAGHMIWLPMAYLPFLFLAYLKGIVRPTFLFVAAGLLALMFFEGATYIIIFSGLFLVLYAFLYACQIKSLKPLFSLLVIFFLAIFFSGPKLFPALEVLIRYPHQHPAGVALPWADLYAIFLGEYQAVYWHVLPAFPFTGWWEFGCYLGFIPAILFIASFRLFKKWWPLLVSAVFFFILGLGNLSSLSPWTILHRFPILNATAPSARVYFVFVFIVSIMAAVYLDHLIKKLAFPKIINISLFLLILGWVALDLYHVDLPIVYAANAPFTPVDPTFKKDNKFQQIFMPDEQKFSLWGWSAMYPAALKNRGIINGYEALPITTNAVAVGQPGYRGEYYLMGGKGDVSNVYWSPNKMVFALAVRSPDTLVINQNFDKNWHTFPGREVKPLNGLLSVPVTPALGRLVIYYLPFSFITGLIFWLLGSFAFFLRLRIFRWLKLTG